jgi:hypothetical protein
MDQKLLDALNNISIGLEQLVEALNSKEESKSGVSDALKSEDFITKIKSIDEGVKNLQKDTQEILKNQKTIIDLQKSASGTGVPTVDAAGDPKKKETIKDGLSIILLIAAGVLAVGLAFKIIGEVDFASVIALSISLPLLAIAFEKIAKIEDLTPSKMFDVFLVTVAMSISIAVSSFILSAVQPIGILQLITIVLIGAAFAAMGFGIGKLIKDIAPIGPLAALVAPILPLVLVAVSYAIAKSSEVLKDVQVVGVGQLFTTILIAAAFSVISFGIGKMISGLKDASLESVLLLPLVLVAISYAIVWSSNILKDVNVLEPMTLLNIILFTATLALSSFLFGLLIFGLDKLNVTLGKAIVGGLSTIAISGAIMASSLIISEGKYDKYPSLGWSLGVALSLGAFSLAVAGLGSMATSGIGALAIAAGAISAIVVAGTIAVSSHILNEGIYEKYPTFGWSLGVGMSLGAFGLGALALGTAIVATGGLGALAIGVGLGAVVIIAESIVKTSEILAGGTYEGGPNKEWAEGISIALGAFSPVYKMLMAAGLLDLIGVGGVGPEDFSKAITTVSGGIVEAAKFFAESDGVFNPEKAPKKEWAEGVGLAIGAFSPVYGILMNQSWFGKGVKVEDFTNGIDVITKGIIQSAKTFGEAEAVFNPEKAPKKEWAEGVSLAIGAFAPIFDLINNSTFSGAAVNTLLRGISSITSSIVSVSNKLANGNYSFTIPDTFLTNIAKNIKSYVGLLEWLDEKDVKTGTFGVNKYATGIIQIANAYGKLNSSLSNLSSTIQNIEVEKLSALKNLTGSIVLMSLMDSTQFETMMDSLEKKAKVFVDVINELPSSEIEAKTAGVKSPGGVSSAQDQTNKQMLGVLASIDSKLGVISSDAKSISKYIKTLDTGDGLKNSKSK